MRLISWNINGLASAIKNGFEDNIKKLSPDFLCLQEIKITNELNLKLEDYNKYYNLSKKGGYAGVAIFAKEKAENVIYGMPIINDYGEEENVDKESRVITLEYNDFYVVSVYVPCSSGLIERKNYREDFDNNFLQYIEKLNNLKDVLIGGDFNICHNKIDVSTFRENRKIKMFSNEDKMSFENLLDLGFIDTYRFFHPQMRKYTFWNNEITDRKDTKLGWRLDYFLISDYLRKNIREANILSDVEGSDHCPIELILQL